MTEQSGERTLLSGALSIEFSDCSVAAADLNHVVAERMPYKKRSSMRVLGEDDTFKVYSADLHERSIYSTEKEHVFELDGHESRFVLGQKAVIKSHGIPETKRKTAIRRREVTIPARPEEVEFTGDPFLAVEVGSDVLLPIVSFARRADGNCSYVQLGQEMDDDSFFVTTLDEQTNRHQLIEALRAYTKKQDLDDEQIALIQSFIDSQAEIHREKLDKEYEAQLAKTADFRLTSSSSQTRRLSVVKKGRPTTGNYSFYSLIPPVVTSSGRTVSIAIARPQGDTSVGKTVEVMAITRESLALPLMSLNPLFGEANPLLPIDERDKSRIVRDLLHLCSLEPMKPHLYTPNSSTDYEVKKNISYLTDLGLAEIGRNYARSAVAVPPELCRILDNYFAYPLEGSEPTEGAEHPFKKALEELYGQRRPYAEGLLGRLGVEEALGELIGLPERDQERFFHYLGRIATRDGGAMSAIFHNVQINNTSGDISIGAAVKAKDEAYIVSVVGRPLAMTDEPEKPLITAWANPASKTPVQHFDSKNPFSKADLAEVTDILARIYSTRLDRR